MFNKNKPDKIYAELKELLLSLRSKYENVSCMGDFVDYIDEELEGIDGGYLDKEKAENISLRIYNQESFYLDKHLYQIENELEQKDDTSSDNVSTYNEPQTSIEMASTTSSDDDEAIYMRVSNDSIDATLNKKFQKYRVSIYAPTNIPSGSKDLISVMNTSIKDNNKTPNIYHFIYEQYTYRIFYYNNGTACLKYRTMYVEILGPALILADGNAQVNINLKLEKDVDKNSLCQTELEDILSWVARSCSHYSSKSYIDGYKPIEIEVDYSKLKDNDFRLLRACIARAKKTNTLL